MQIFLILTSIAIAYYDWCYRKIPLFLVIINYLAYMYLAININICIGGLLLIFGITAIWYSYMNEFPIDKLYLILVIATITYLRYIGIFKLYMLAIYVIWLVIVAALSNDYEKIPGMTILTMYQLFLTIYI